MGMIEYIYNPSYSGGIGGTTMCKACPGKNVRAYPKN
jgi:hypothetical protein